MSRPTPETDAALRGTQGLFRASAHANGFADLTRNLERQNVEARELARELRDALVAHYEEYFGYSIRGDVHNKVMAALVKAKEVLS